MRRTELLVVALLGVGWGALATADAGDSQQRIDDLERRIEELESEAEGEGEATSAMGRFAGWTEYIRLGANANMGYYDGESFSVQAGDDFQVWDARFFLDAELGDALVLFDETLLRNAGFSFEWDLVRLGSLSNDVGEIYVELQGFGDSSWVSMQVGRFQIPVGENYLRFSKGSKDNPFITNTVSGPWWWDEGLKLYGRPGDSWFSYVASLTEAETSFNVDTNSDLQFTMKLIADPLPWLHLSVSGLYSGAIGTDTEASSGGALWLGETWARQFGKGSSVPNYTAGGVLPDGPTKIERTGLVGADAIFDWPEKARLWLYYGAYWIDQDSDVYDRLLHGWIVELLLYGSLVTPELRSVYLGVRANGLGTYDPDEGYLLDVRQGSTFGYNMKSLDAYSVVLGWKLYRAVTFRAEYSHYRVGLVRGVPESMNERARHIDVWGVELGVGF